MPPYQTNYNTYPPVEPKSASPAYGANNETAVANTACLQALLKYSEIDSTSPVSVVIHFLADPGAGSTVLIQASDVDIDSEYCTLANGSIAYAALDPTNFNYRFDASTLVAAKYLRVKVGVLTNAGTKWTVRYNQ